MTEQQATTNALTGLYSRDEYVEPLRSEVQGHMFDGFKATAVGLPLLDSFLKESARVSAFESSESPHLHAISKVHTFEEAKTYSSWRAATSIGTLYFLRWTVDLNWQLDVCASPLHDAR